jgi:hypothetical protein
MGYADAYFRCILRCGFDRAIILFARFFVGSEFVTGFCFGGAVVSGCVIISDLDRGYREFKRQSDKIDSLNRRMNEEPPRHP